MKMLFRFPKKAIISNLNIQRYFAKHSFLLPDLGEGLKDAQILEYFVKEGQTVKQYDLIAKVSTLKSTIDISAEYPGKILKLLVNVDDKCEVGAPLYEIDVVKEGESHLLVESDGVTEEITQITDQVQEQTQEIKQVQKQAQKIEQHQEQQIQHKQPPINLDDAIKKSIDENEVLSTPAVRNLAKELQVNLAFVKGTGPKGRVLKEDVLIFHEIVKKEAEKILKIYKKRSSNESEQKNIKPQVAEHTPVLMSQFEQGMVKTMTYATSVPHFNLHEEYDISDIHMMRGKLKDSGINISLFALIVKSFSLALSENPKMNSTYFPDKDEFTYFSNHFHNISIAIDSKFGLAAPNIKNVQTLSSEEIDLEIKKLKDLTDNQKLKNQHLTGGTIAMSNIGTISGYLATPLNLPGQCCIVALGKVAIKPVWNKKTGVFEPKQILPVSFGCDHRVLDGATVARFSKRWRHYIEEPYLIFSKLK